MTLGVASRRRPRLRVMTVPRVWIGLSLLSVPAAFTVGLLAGRWTAPAPSLAWTELPPAPRSGRDVPPAAPSVPALGPPPEVEREPETQAELGTRSIAERRAEGPQTEHSISESGLETQSASPAGPKSEDDRKARTPISYARRAPRKGFGLQVAAHRSLAEAEAFLRIHASRLAPLAPIHVVRRKIGGEEWFRVRVGLFPERARAVAAAARLPAPLAGAMVVRYR
ncbi:MAG: SPOR domain-containing protein [Myxococcota bacterium]